MPTPTDLITAAQSLITHGQNDLASAQTLLDQAKAALVPVPPNPTISALTVVSGSGSGLYAAGTVVPITADTPQAGQQFNGWLGPVAAPLSPTTTVTMPSAPLTVSATYAPIVVPPSPSGRIATLVHLGAFNAPLIIGPDVNGYAYGGTALSYNPARNSLFIGGMSNAAKVGELSIPGLSGTATSLQAPADACGGKIQSINPSDPNQKLIGGTLVTGTQLIVSAYSYYDGSGSQSLSHFSGPTQIGSAVIGPLKVGPLGAGFYSGYMGWIDPAWRGRLRGPAFTGNSCLGVISRTSYGPSVAAFDPSSMTPTGAVELVGYPDQHQTLGPWNQANEFFGGSDEVKGVAMPVGFGTVLFVGRHGTTFCYGDTCPDPTDHSKGVHGYPYRAVAWLYDANDLAAVAAGSRLPWDVKPYAMIDLPGIDRNHRIGGCALDPASGRLYVAELMGNGTLPVIHIYEARS